MAVFLVVVLVHPQPPLLGVTSVAPSMVLHTQTGASVDVLRSAGRRPVVAEFFETTCTTCQQEAASLCSLQRLFPDTRVVAVDAAVETATALPAFAQRYEPSECGVQLLLDPGATVSQRYEVTVVPTVYVIDMNGKIAYAAFGASGIDGLRAVLQHLG